MHYWNKANFDGLKEMAEFLQQKGGYEGYVSYCLLREKGLKKEAFIELREFIETSRRLPLNEQRVIACELAELYFYNRDVHQLLPHPAVVYVGDVLQKWCDEGPSSSEPYRWCGIICGRPELFQCALQKCPDDPISLSSLALEELHEVDFITHHLCESILLGSEFDAEAALNRALSYATRLPISEAKTMLMKEITYYRSLLSAWQEYQLSSRQMPFPEWSVEHGYKFPFGIVVYYDES